jgi:biotin carboxyl carrier protein
VFADPGDGDTEPARVYVHEPARGDGVALIQIPRFPPPVTEAAAGGCVAPMPGKVIQVAVSEGRTVEAGDTLVVLEAMKMEHAVEAAIAGVVTRVAVAVGDQVDTDQLLVVIEPAPDAVATPGGG